MFIKFVINIIEREKEIINMVHQDINFFRIQKIRFTLPKKLIEKEYNIKKYKNYKKWIETKWLKNEKGFVERLLFFFHKPKELEFMVEISNYGPLGFYNADKNIITINMNNKGFDPVKIIKHEMIHIMVEPYIKKYRVDHNCKEFITNIILNILDKDV